MEIKMDALKEKIAEIIGTRASRTNNMVINTEKFLEWLDERIIEEYRCEAECVGKGHYSMAAEHAEARKTMEFIMRCVTGEDKELGGFMEEVEE